MDQMDENLDFDTIQDMLKTSYIDMENRFYFW